MKRIRTIEEAKKYLNKIIYFIDTEKSEPTKLYIGGVNLFYNQVNYDVIGFEAYENKSRTKGWGNIKIEAIKEEFEEVDRTLIYTFSEELAKRYLIDQKISKKEGDKRYDIKVAKELLDKHKINYEIFN